MLYQVLILNNVLHKMDILGFEGVCINEYCASCIDAISCSSCVDGRWGDQCTFECQCLGGSCWQSEGICVSCPDGYYNDFVCVQCPDNCKRCNWKACLECNEGYMLDIEDQQCITANRLDTCIGVYNARTGFCSLCENGYWGFSCNEPCGNYCINKDCNKDNGNCPCKSGHYGDTCKNNCSIGCATAECSKHGFCYPCRGGFYGYYCTGSCMSNCVECFNRDTCVGCKPGYWGSNCSMSCSTGCISGTCSQASGICECAEGYYGPTCQPCGAGCVGGICQMSGECSCQPGYYGNRCDQPCGKGCVDKTCHATLGICQCNDNFFGFFCNETCSANCLECDSPTVCTLCTTGFYGESCKDSCGFACLHNTCDIDGRCPCIEKYTEQQYCYGNNGQENNTEGDKYQLTLSIVSLVLAGTTMISFVVFAFVSYR